jgi:Transcription factor WhiB
VRRRSDARLRREAEAAERRKWEAEIRKAETDAIVAHALAILRRPAWHRDAACREHAEFGWITGPRLSAPAQKRVCGSCLVEGECLAYALTGPDVEAVWGGTTEREPKALRVTSAA